MAAIFYIPTKTLLLPPSPFQELFHQEVECTLSSPTCICTQTQLLTTHGNLQKSKIANGESTRCQALLWMPRYVLTQLLNLNNMCKPDFRVSGLTRKKVSWTLPHQKPYKPKWNCFLSLTKWKRCLSNRNWIFREISHGKETCREWYKYVFLPQKLSKFSLNQQLHSRI